MITDNIHTWDQERFDKLLDQALQSGYASRERMLNQKDTELAQHRWVNEARFGPQGLEERVATMRFGPGGLEERLGRLQFGGLPELRNIEATALEKVLPYALSEKLYGVHRAYYDAMDTRNRYIKNWLSQLTNNTNISAAKPSMMSTTVNTPSGNLTKNTNEPVEFSLNTMGNPLYNVNDDQGVAKPNNSTLSPLGRINRINTSNMF